MLRTLGFCDGFGVDHVISKRLSGPVLKFNLLNEKEFEHVCNLLSDPKCIFAHFAPPCETSSRARHIQRPSKYNPPVLRTEEYPNGLPHLTGDLAARVDSANRLYHQTTAMLRLCIKNNVLWSIENPGRSYMWLTPSMAAFLDEIPHFDTFFHHCCYGSSRRKLTRLVHNIPTLLELEAFCDNQHAHEPWGHLTNSWASSLEIAYPWALCRAIAQAVVLCLQDLGAECPTPPFAVQEASLQTLRAATDVQSRRHLPPMVPEFAYVTTHPASAPLPPLARPLSTPSMGSIASVKKHVQPSSQRDAMIKIGIHWAPHEFVEKALEVGHPALSIHNFPPEMMQAVEAAVNLSPWRLTSDRTETVRRWVLMSQDLKEEEDRLRGNLPDRIDEILKSKRLALFRKLLEEVEHADDLVRDLCSGFDLTGRLPESHCFKPKFRPATISEDSLRSFASLARKSVLVSAKSCGDSEIDEALFFATEKELQKGYLEGPVDPQTMPEGGTLTKRFPVCQKTKVRPIDDYRSSMVNSAVTQPEGVSIHSIDHIAAMVTLWLRRLEDAKTKKQLMAKCWDLEDAYKQVPLSQEAFALDSYLVVYNPRKQAPEVYRQRVLPFGSVASVTAFLRCALAIWVISARSLKLAWSCYFDDFLSVADEATAAHTDLCISSLFRLLGWKVSSKKLLPFSTCCKVLGVELDLRETLMWQASIRNTEDRRDELLSDLDKILGTKVLKKHEGERLRGRLQFASCQVFGKRFNRCLKSLTTHVVSGRSMLSDDTPRSLGEIRALIQVNDPRVLNRRLAEFVHMYFDASYDADGFSGIGGVLFDCTGTCQKCFSFELSSAVLHVFRRSGAKTVIQELETLAILVGVSLWGDLLRGRRAVVFTDSESVRGGLLKSWTKNDKSDLLLEEVFRLEESLDSAMWFERVPSQSNPSDFLSRQIVREWMGVRCESMDFEKWFASNVQMGVMRDID